VGFNTNSFPIRELVVETITSLRKKDPTRMFSSLYSQLVQLPFVPRKRAEQRLDISMHRSGGNLLLQ
jgi:hypothetical protein